MKPQGPLRRTDLSLSSQGAFKREPLSLTPCFSWVDEGRSVASTVLTVSAHFSRRGRVFLNSPCLSRKERRVYAAEASTSNRSSGQAPPPLLRERGAPQLCCRPATPRAGFTLIEVLMVISIIAILAALLMPSLSAARSKAKQAGCQNNLKQLALSVLMYSADNDGKLPENTPEGQGKNPWVSGSMKVLSDSTNETFIRQGKLFPYANNVAVYRCPADPSRTFGLPRARSYSMNGWMGSRYMEAEPTERVFRTFVRESELAVVGAAKLWMLGDEHEASIDDGWFLVTMDDSQPFASSPATRHQLGYALNFADGHVAVYKLRDPTSLRLGLPGAQFSPYNSDWLRLKQVTTLK